MKNVQHLVFVVLTVLLSAVSCAPETINDDEQLINEDIEIYSVDRSKIERPGNQRGR